LIECSLRLSAEFITNEAFVCNNVLRIANYKQFGTAVWDRLQTAVVHSVDLRKGKLDPVNQHQQVLL
jgi:hypothetical protein